MLLVRWRSRMGITWLRQCVIPFLTSSTRMHPTIPIHTMLCPEACTASCDANLSRERFVPFGRTYGAPYSQLVTRQSSLAYCFNSIPIWTYYYFLYEQELLTHSTHPFFCLHCFHTLIFLQKSCFAFIKNLALLHLVLFSFASFRKVQHSSDIRACSVQTLNVNDVKLKTWVRYLYQIYIYIVT